MVIWWALKGNSTHPTIQPTILHTLIVRGSSKGIRTVKLFFASEASISKVCFSRSLSFNKIEIRKIQNNPFTKTSDIYYLLRPIYCVIFLRVIYYVTFITWCLLRDVYYVIFITWYLLRDIYYVIFITWCFYVIYYMIIFTYSKLFKLFTYIFYPRRKVCWTVFLCFYVEATKSSNSERGLSPN